MAVRRRLITFTSPSETDLEAIRQELKISRSLAVRLGLAQLRKIIQQRPTMATAVDLGGRVIDVKEGPGETHLDQTLS